MRRADSMPRAAPAGGRARREPAPQPRQAAPLAQALLAGLAERQWQGLQRQLDEKLDEWREREADEPDGRQRARRYVRGLSNWLGDLTPAAEQEAHAQALARLAAQRCRAVAGAAARRALDCPMACAPGRAANTRPAWSC